MTCSYMCKNGGEVPGQDAVKVSWNKAVEMWGSLASWLRHLVHTGQAPRQGVVRAS